MYKLFTSAATAAALLLFSNTSTIASSAGFSEAQVCKAGIGTIMGRDPSSMKTRTTSNGVLKVSYVRPFDRKKFSYKCKIEGNRILWGNSDGRWRTHSADSKVTYRVDGELLQVTDKFSDGSASRNQYTFSQLGN